MEPREGASMGDETARTAGRQQDQAEEKLDLRWLMEDEDYQRAYQQKQLEEARRRRQEAPKNEGRGCRQLSLTPPYGPAPGTSG
jgi:hypothetical protein